MKLVVELAGVEGELVRVVHKDGLGAERLRTSQAAHFNGRKAMGKTQSRGGPRAMAQGFGSALHGARSAWGLTSGSSPRPVVRVMPPGLAAAAASTLAYSGEEVPPGSPRTDRYSPPLSCGSCRNPILPKSEKYLSMNFGAAETGTSTCTASAWPSLP